MNDCLDTVRTYRPRNIREEWDVETELDRLLAQREPIGRNRRVGVLGAVAAAAAVTLVGVGAALPSGSPGGPSAAAAATLHHLSVIAGRQGGTVGAREFAYVAQSTEQTAPPGSSPILGQTRVNGLDRSSSQQWTAPDGDLSLFRALGRPAACIEAVPYRRSRVTDYALLSATDLAALPTDSADLARVFERHPQGQLRGPDAVFSDVGDLLRSGLARPALRAAAIQVLAATAGIAVDPDVRDALGRRAIRADLPYRYGTESLFFDPATSRILEEQTTQSGDLYRSVTTASEVVRSIPSGLPVCPAPTVPPG